MIFEVGWEGFGSFMSLCFLSGKTEKMGKGQNNRVTTILYLLFSFTVLQSNWADKVNLKTSATLLDTKPS